MRQRRPVEPCIDARRAGLHIVHAAGDQVDKFTQPFGLVPVGRSLPQSHPTLFLHALDLLPARSPLQFHLKICVPLLLPDCLCRRCFEPVNDGIDNASATRQSDNTSRALKVTVYSVLPPVVRIIQFLRAGLSPVSR